MFTLRVASPALANAVPRKFCPLSSPRPPFSLPLGMMSPHQPPQSLLPSTFFKKEVMKRMLRQIDDKWLKASSGEIEVFVSPVWQVSIVVVEKESSLKSPEIKHAVSRNYPIFIVVPYKHGRFVRCKLFVHFNTCFNGDMSIDLNVNHGKCVVSEGEFGKFWVFKALVGENKSRILRISEIIRKTGGVIQW